MSSADDSPTLAASRASLEVRDPLSASTVKVIMRLWLKLANNGVMMVLTTEARQGNRSVLPLEKFMHLQSGVLGLSAIHERFSKSFGVMAGDIHRVVADDDFEILPRKLVRALAQ